MSTELAIMMPVILIIALVAVLFVRVHRHGAYTQAAADTAARAASWAPDAAAAQTLASGAATEVCANSTAVIPADGWQAPDLGALRPGRVVVNVTCSIDYSAFGILGVSGTRTSTAVGIATIEYWRSG